MHLDLSERQSHWSCRYMGCRTCGNTYWNSNSSILRRLFGGRASCRCCRSLRKRHYPLRTNRVPGAREFYVVFFWRCFQITVPQEFEQISLVSEINIRRRVVFLPLRPGLAQCQRLPPARSGCQDQAKEKRAKAPGLVPHPLQRSLVGTLPL